MIDETSTTAYQVGYILGHIVTDIIILMGIWTLLSWFISFIKRKKTKNKSMKDIGLKIDDSNELKIEHVATTGQEALDQINAIAKFYNDKMNRMSNEK